MSSNIATSKISTSQRHNLKQFLLKKAGDCVHPPQDKLKHNFVTPTMSIVPGADDDADTAERSLVGHYLQMYDWDACFFSQAAHRLGLDQLPLDIVESFFDLQQPSGYVPRTVSPHTTWDQGGLFKPFACQSLIQSLTTSKSSQASIPVELLSALNKYFVFFLNHRRHQSGLYHWRNVLESGVDNNLALLSPLEASRNTNKDIGNFPDGALLACDLNAYLVADFMCFSQLLSSAGKIELAGEYSQLAQDLSQRIESLLWNEELGLYCNLDPSNNKQIAIRSWTAMVPALLGIARSENTARVIHSNMLAEEHFLRPAGLSSLAASEPLYNQSRRGLYGRVIVSNWQGPMWVLPNVLAVRCLIQHKLHDEAKDLSLRVTNTMASSLQESGTLFENYHAETGQPLWAPQFMSWNVLALELLDVLD